MNAEHRERFYSVEQASDVLGLTPGRIRQMLRAGDLEGIPPDQTGPQRSWKIPARVVMEHLRARPPREDRDRETPQDPHAGELIDELRAHVEDLRGQLAEEREARRRADTIIAQLARANEEQAQTIRAIEPASTRSTEHSAPSEATGSPVSAGAEGGKGAAPQQQQTAAQPRPWWRRVIGG